ncbi:MAG: hypothetical protein HZB14_03090 [Actinobacteria bacterium]|nr:hypothetical protein [Actinomycetota bacterium]
MPTGLLEPRLYRAAFAPALLALIVLAFSLKSPQPGIAPELAPPTFSGQRVTATARQLTEAYGERRSGSAEDSQVAELVRARLASSGWVANRYSFEAKTLTGSHKLTNVIGVRAGPSDRRLVIVASRDGAPGSLSRSGAVETGVLLELARVLQGRAFDHTLVLASVSGGVDGGLGAAELARRLRRPVDGVIVVRNVTAAETSGTVLSWFDSRLAIDRRFEQTMRRLAAIEIGAPGGETSILGQLVRLGFPIALGEQATYPGNGLTAVSLSPGGEPLVKPDISKTAQSAAAGRAALRALTTFDGEFRPVEPAAAPLRVGGKLIPAWALILFVGMLMLPLVVTAVDGWARARRRQELATRGLLAAPAALLSLVAVALVMRGLGVAGAIDAPSLPAEPEALGGAGPVVFGLLALLLAPVGALVAVAAVRQLSPKGGESGYALWLAIAGLVVFALNPVAALFWIPVLHLLLLLLLAGTRPGRTQVWLTTLIGLLPVAAAIIYYPVVLGIGLVDSLRFAVLLQAGGFAGVLPTLGGCLVAAAVFAATLQLHWASPPPARQGAPASRSPLLH